MSNHRLRDDLILVGMVVLFLLVWGRGASQAGQSVELWGFPGRSPSDDSAWGAGMKSAIERFERMNPDIEVKVVGSNDLDRLLTAIAGGASGDVTIVDRFLLASLAASGAFQPLDPYLADSDVLVEENMPPGAWEELHGFDGKLYGAPVLYDNVGFWSLYYNRKLFAEAGYDPDQAPETWEQFRTIARRLTRVDGDEVIQLGFWPQSWDIHAFGRANQAQFVSEDGRTVTFDSTPVVETLEFLDGVMQDMGGAAIVNGLAGDFATGSVGMIIHGEWYLWDLIQSEEDLDYSVGFTPTPTGDQFTAWIGGWSWAMPVTAKNPAGGARLLEFLASRDFSEAFIIGAQQWARDRNELLVLPGAFYFTHPDLVREHNIPPLMERAPRAINALNHFLTAAQRAYRVYSRERTPIQNEVWAATLDAWTRSVVNREAPPQAILSELDQSLQVQLDEAWARLDAQPAE